MFLLKKSVTAKWLANHLELSIAGDEEYIIRGVSALDAAVNGSLSFANKTAIDSRFGNVALIAVEGDCASLLVSATPRLDFIRALALLDEEIGFEKYETLPQIHPSAIIGENAVIEDGVKIGADTIIEHNVVLMSGTIIGEKCIIRANSSIGGDGFGFARLENGTPIRFKHLGRVVIGDNVEIGYNNTIASGALSDTIIEDYVKTDNLVHIAHNCHIGWGTFITACAELSGGVRVGREVWIAPNVSINQKIVIGDEALVGLGAVVTKNVEPKTVVAGNPAKFLKNL